MRTALLILLSIFLFIVSKIYVRFVNEKELKKFIFLNPFLPSRRLIDRNTKTQALTAPQTLTGPFTKGRNHMTEHLLRKAKKGDADAFCSLMDMQTQSMYKIARSYLKNDEDAADAIQDTI